MIAIKKSDPQPIEMISSGFEKNSIFWGLFWFSKFPFPSCPKKLSPHEKTPFLVTQKENSNPWWKKMISEALKGKIWGVFWFFSFSRPSSPKKFEPQTKTWFLSSIQIMN